MHNRKKKPFQVGFFMFRFLGWVFWCQPCKERTYERGRIENNLSSRNLVLQLITIRNTTKAGRVHHPPSSINPAHVLS